MSIFNPYAVVRQFEDAIAEYTGAPYVVTVNSCTAALMLAVAYFNVHRSWVFGGYQDESPHWPAGKLVSIPKRTYCSVPMSIIHAGGRPTFRDEDWTGAYQLKPLPVWDAARRFTSGMYQDIYRYVENDRIVTAPQTMVCVSFHWAKILGIQQGGAILAGDEGAAEWLRRARFDGRREGVHPKDDVFDMIGFHCYMSPEIAAEGLMRLSLLPEHNADLPNSDYPDLSLMPIFQ